MDWSKYSSLKSSKLASLGKEKQTIREAVEGRDAVYYKEGDKLPEGESWATYFQEGDDIPDTCKVGDIKTNGVKVGDIKVLSVKAVEKEEREYVALSQKRWDAESGEALDDSKHEFSLSDLEREKSRFDDEIARAKAQSDGLKKAIADFKKV